MTNTGNNSKRLYFKDTNEWINVPEELYTEYMRYRDRTRKRIQGRGECTLNKERFWYASFPEVNVELYTDKKNPKLEKKLEKIFAGNDIYWNKSETWIDSERMYEVLYELTL